MKTVLEMIFLSELILVDINLWNKKTEQYNHMSITVDTGASVTTISTDILHKLGYNTAAGKEKRVITASGVEYVKSIKMEKMKLGAIELIDIEVYAHTFPESSFSLGVLGLNVLKNFNVKLIFSKNEIELDKYD